MVVMNITLDVNSKCLDFKSYVGEWISDLLATSSALGPLSSQSSISSLKSTLLLPSWPGGDWYYGDDYGDDDDDVDSVEDDHGYPQPTSMFVCVLGDDCPSKCWVLNKSVDGVKTDFWKL